MADAVGAPLPLHGHQPLATASLPLGFLKNLRRLHSLSARELTLPMSSPPPKAGGVVTLPLEQGSTEVCVLHGFQSFSVGSSSRHPQ